MRGLGAVDREDDAAPRFDHLWEARVFALMKRCMDEDLFELDEVRSAIEHLPATTYLSAPYYEKWFLGLRQVLVIRGLIAADDVPLSP